MYVSDPEEVRIVSHDASCFILYYHFNRDVITKVEPRKR